MNKLIVTIRKTTQLQKMTDAATGPDAAMEKTTAPVIVMVRPPVIRQFCGDEGDCSVFEDFRADIQLAWQDRPDFSEARKLDFLMRHVGPDVRQEIACLDDLTRGKGHSVLKALVEIYGEQRTSEVLMQQLLATNQWSGESLRRYSCRVKAAYDTLVARQRALKQDVSAEALLLRQFERGLADRYLRNHLRNYVEKSNRCTFVDARRVVLRWYTEEEEVHVQSISASPAPPDSCSHGPERSDGTVSVDNGCYDSDNA